MTSNNTCYCVPVCSKNIGTQLENLIREPQMRMLPFKMPLPKHNDNITQPKKGPLLLRKGHITDTREVINLTHWGLNKKATILHMTFLNAFSTSKNYCVLTLISMKFCKVYFRHIKYILYEILYKMLFLGILSRNGQMTLRIKVNDPHSQYQSR